MLNLQVSSRHVRVGFDRLRRILLAVVQIVFVNNLERERVEDYLFEIFVNMRRMIGWDQSHLFGEREVEIEDTTVRAITSLIIDVAIRANVAPRMSAVYLIELLIHRPRRGTPEILATKRHKRHKNYFTARCALGVFGWYRFSFLCFLCLFAIRVCVV